MKSAIPRPLMPEDKEITKMETNNPNVVTSDGTPSEPKAQASTARPYKPMDFYHRFLKKIFNANARMES